MIAYHCSQCGTEMESPDCMIGSAETCPQCKSQQAVPICEGDRPASIGQLEAAEAIGIKFKPRITKADMAVLLTTYERMIQFINAVWRDLAGRPTSDFEEAGQIVSSLAGMIMNIDTKIPQKISKLIDGGGDLWDIIHRDNILYDFVADSLVDYWGRHTGSRFPLLGQE